MADMIEKTIYYRSILNVLEVVETCPKNLRKDLKKHEYEQALAILEYNSQWVDFKPLEDEIKDKLIKFAKNPDKSKHIRKDVAKLMKKGKVLTVEQILKLAED